MLWGSGGLVPLERGFLEGGTPVLYKAGKSLWRSSAGIWPQGPEFCLHCSRPAGQVVSNFSEPQFSLLLRKITVTYVTECVMLATFKGIVWWHSRELHVATSAPGVPHLACTGMPTRGTLIAPSALPQPPGTPMLLFSFWEFALGTSSKWDPTVFVFVAGL